MGTILTFVATQFSNGLMDTEDVFRKLVGLYLRQSFAIFLRKFHMVLIVVSLLNMSWRKEYDGSSRIAYIGSIFFISNVSMEVSCQALSKTRAESIRVFIYSLISPSLWLSEDAQQNR